MAAAIGCHLVLLMVMLRPATPSHDTPADVENDATALQLRFVSPSRRTPAIPVMPRPSAAPPVVSRNTSVKGKKPPSTQRMVQEAAPQAEADTVAAAPDAVDPYANNPSSTGDGGFQDRLRNAQHTQGIHGVPGSDRRVAPGIVLTDPMNQGIDSVMRNAQRLFGVTNHHCIDVDALQNLSPDALIARHLTAADVQKESEKYHCNRPLGLNF